MKTTSERQAAYTERMKSKGFALVRVWVPESEKEALKEYAKKLTDQKERKE